MPGLLLALLLAGPAAPVPTASPARPVPTDRSGVTIIEAGSIPPDTQGPKAADDGAPAVFQAEPITADPPAKVHAAPVPTDSSVPATPVPGAISAAIPMNQPVPDRVDGWVLAPASPAAPVSADSPVPPPSPMRVRLAVDLPVIALGLSIALGIELIAGEQRWAGCGACDTTGLNPLDRTVLGKHNAAARTYSDIGLVTAVALPFALDLGDALIQRARDRPAWRSRHMRGWGRDLVVLLETFAVNYAATNLVKVAVQRPRPFSYDAESSVGDPQEGDARLSFFSGHTSTGFAMATAYASLFQARHPRSRWIAPVWVLGLSFASTIAVARVEAGKHFWTDVIVGAVAGTSIGVLVPALHRSERLGGRVALRLAPTRTGSLLVMQGRF